MITVAIFSVGIGIGICIDRASRKVERRRLIAEIDRLLRDVLDRHHRPR